MFLIKSANKQVEDVKLGGAIVQVLIRPIHLGLRKSRGDEVVDLSVLLLRDALLKCTR